jgi:hypothetical protein
VDWWHAILGGLLIVAVLARGFTRRRDRKIEWTFKWEDHHDDSADGGHQ